MITLADIRDWLKSFGLFDNYYIGRIDSKKRIVLAYITCRTQEGVK